MAATSGKRTTFVVGPSPMWLAGNGRWVGPAHPFWSTQGGSASGDDHRAKDLPGRFSSDRGARRTYPRTAWGLRGAESGRARHRLVGRRLTPDWPRRPGQRSVV